MKCPECGAPAFVKQTRQARDGTRRRHHCQDKTCGCRFTTLEQTVRDHTYRAGRKNPAR